LAPRYASIPTPCSPCSCGKVSLPFLLFCRHSLSRSFLAGRW
jgi:hypothetical protein